jgi:serine/threonine protein kinase
MTKKRSILVVDDDSLNRKVVSLNLEREGFEVLGAADGQQALGILASRHIDLMLLDRVMPGVSGIEVLKTLRNKYSTNTLPVVMMTAVTESLSIAEALEAGANDYITKPIDFTVALARVRAQLRDKPNTTNDTFAGKYRLEEKIGSGGFSTVYRATHIALQRVVAVKILRGGLSSEEAHTRFRSEGISSAQATHPNVVSVIDFGVLGSGEVFLVMELLTGCTLEEELKSKGPMSPGRSAELLLPICDALSNAHRRGIIHRDVKPSNIFLHRMKTNKEVPKLLDFGVAKLTGNAAAENITTKGCILGTANYLAPERLRGEAYDGRVDVYSLGITLYEMLTGRLPFISESAESMAIAMMHLNTEPRVPSSLIPSIPRALDELVMSTLAKHPSHRPGIDELAQRLSLATVGGLYIQTGRRIPLDATPIQMPALSKLDDKS